MHFFLWEAVSGDLNMLISDIYLQTYRKKLCKAWNSLDEKERSKNGTFKGYLTEILLCINICFCVGRILIFSAPCCHPPSEGFYCHGYIVLFLLAHMHSAESKVTYFWAVLC